MSEATYYILARCQTETDAETLCQQFRDLNRMGMHAYNWWQAHRSESPEQFWPYFRKQFPTVIEYLQLDARPVSQPGNELAGLLDFIDEDEGEIECVDREVRGCGTVWHCADWSLLDDWLIKHGAVNVAWASDENELDWWSLLRQQFTA